MKKLKFILDWRLIVMNINKNGEKWIFHIFDFVFFLITKSSLFFEFYFSFNEQSPYSIARTPIKVIQTFAPFDHLAEKKKKDNSINFIDNTFSLKKINKIVKVLLNMYFTCFCYLVSRNIFITHANMCDIFYHFNVFYVFS